jgi:hypothetical protein
MISEASFFLHVLHSYHKSRLGTSLRILALCWLACISKTAQVNFKSGWSVVESEEGFGHSCIWWFLDFCKFFSGIHVCFQQC